MCDRDESWVNLNIYQICFNYRGKMRYKNYSSKEKKFEIVYFIYYRKCFCKFFCTKLGVFRVVSIFMFFKVLLEWIWRCFFFIRN